MNRDKSCLGHGLSHVTTEAPKRALRRRPSSSRGQCEVPVSLEEAGQVHLECEGGVFDIGEYY